MNATKLKRLFFNILKKAHSPKIEKSQWKYLSNLLTLRKKLFFMFTLFQMMGLLKIVLLLFNYFFDCMFKFQNCQWQGEFVQISCLSRE